MLQDPLEDLISKLDQALTLCQSLGLGEISRLSRFAEYRRRLIRMLELFKGVDGEARREAERQFFLEDARISLIAVVEGTEFGTLVPYLTTCDPELIRPKIKDILSGPLVPVAETPSSNQGRNILFELNIASKLWQAGLEPQVGEHPDLVCQIDGMNVLIEAKRPFGEQGVGKGFKRARSQLRRKLENRPAGSRGVIAVSLARLLGRGDKIIIFGGESVGPVVVRDYLKFVAEAFKSVWLRRGPEIIGILFHTITPMQDQYGGVFVTGQATLAYNLAQIGTLEHRIFEKLAGRLKAVGY